MKKMIYVAGPLTVSGNHIANIRLAVLAGFHLKTLGYIPYIPHLTSFANMVEIRSDEYWMQWCYDMLQHCDVLLRLPGESPGSDKEVKWAAKLGIPVFYSVEELLREVPRDS